MCQTVDFDLMRGEKIAIVGRNGVGKSTFLKALLGRLKPEAGSIRWGRNVKVSYFEQEQLDLHPGKTALAELWDRFPAAYERDVRTMLGNLRFSGETIYKRVEMLSGGEKARLKFAIMMYEEGNVLLLDEPTNHLDLATREVLDQALMRYEGTILAVSHDRYLLSRMPTCIAEMTEEGFTLYKGGYDAYLAARRPGAPAAGFPAAAPEQAARPAPAGSFAGEYHRSKKQRAEAVRRKNRLIEVEQAISDHEYEIERLQASLAAPEISSDYQKVSEVCAQLEQTRERLNALIEEWAELAE